jgi:predicted Fe-S protein YdhL (DUF1289 family)
MFSSLVLSGLVLTAPVSAFAQAGGGMHHFFTPEQRMMYMQAHRGDMDWKSMTPDQRHAKMQEMGASIMAMSDADKTKLKTDMQAKFDSLTPDQKQAVEQKIAERRARHDEMKQQGDHTQ